MAVAMTGCTSCRGLFRKFLSIRTVASYNYTLSLTEEFNERMCNKAR
jgi:hypothetical protein